MKCGRVIVGVYISHGYKPIVLDCLMARAISLCFFMQTSGVEGGGGGGGVTSCPIDNVACCNNRLTGDGSWKDHSCLS